MDWRLLLEAVLTLAIGITGGLLVVNARLLLQLKASWEGRLGDFKGQLARVEDRMESLRQELLNLHVWLPGRYVQRQECDRRHEPRMEVVARKQ